jgi:sirohydrochlorin ferrochelatase
MSDKRREIDWASAEAHDGKVVVALTGKSSKVWNESFDGVLRLLGHGMGGWEKVAHDKKSITVEGLQPKAEGDLRHFLEAVVVQVNAEVADAEPEPQSEPADPQELADQEMTATLRSFGTSQADGPDAA